MSESSVFPGNFAAAEAGIFWDIEGCKIPAHSNATDLLEKIKTSISSEGHHGPVSVRVYGDLTVHQLPSEGITKFNFPAGARYARHTKILEDVVAWAGGRREPATLMLVMCRDVSEDFADVVQLLKSRNYRFLFLYASP